jgi:hypothetical protein
MEQHLAPYLAGLFDGEGSVVIVETKRAARGMRTAFYLKINIVNTHRGVMTLLRDTFGGYLSKGRVHEGWAVCWMWELHSNNAMEFLKTLLPYLVIKKREAQIAIEFQKHMEFYGGHGAIPDKVNEYRRSFRTRIQEAREEYFMKPRE